jgi:hypothetical protein
MNPKTELNIHKTKFLLRRNMALILMISVMDVTNNSIIYKHVTHTAQKKFKRDYVSK